MCKHFSFLLLFSLVGLFSCQNKQLTGKEKMEDFLYLYETLEANYPFFDLAKRKTGVDWLANKNEYIQKIKSTSSDTAYIRTLSSILGTLQDGHTDLFPTTYYDASAAIYNQAAVSFPEYMNWVKAIEKDSLRAKSWSDILRPDKTKKTSFEIAATEKRNSYSDTLLATKKIAIMNIPSFFGANATLDSAKIDHFLSHLQGVEKLIINLQGNGGGSTHYWQNFIVPRLINDTIKYPLYMAIKKGSINREYFSLYFKSDNDSIQEMNREDPFYPKIPDYFTDSSFRLVKQFIEIAPQDPVDFKGSIYLLVDNAVFSASEAFTYFAQTTGWATIAGSTTGGDGAGGGDPIVISLPRSGIKVRYGAFAGFNPDGSLNAEKGTTPDLFIFGRSAQERLDGLIYKLTEE